jgi:hypothetical protein
MQSPCIQLGVGADFFPSKIKTKMLLVILTAIQSSFIKTGQDNVGSVFYHQNMESKFTVRGHFSYLSCGCGCVCGVGVGQ